MRVWRIDVTPDGSKLIAGRQLPPGGRSRPRDQVAILNVNQNPVTVDSLELDVLPLHGPEQPRPAHEQLVLADLPALPPRHRHLARRQLRRDREHRREPARAPVVRLPDALEHVGHGSEPGARLDREVGRGLVPLGAGDGRRDLRRRSPAVAEQPVQPEQLRQLHRVRSRAVSSAPASRRTTPRTACRSAGTRSATPGVRACSRWCPRRPASSSGATRTGSSTRCTGGTDSCRSRAASPCR